MNPFLIIQIPSDCFANSFLEGMRRPPTQFALDPGSINGIAAIMPQPVLYEFDERTGVSTQFGLHLINQITNELNDIYVRPLVMATNVVGFSHLSPSQHPP